MTLGEPLVTFASCPSLALSLGLALQMPREKLLFEGVGRKKVYLDPKKPEPPTQPKRQLFTFGIQVAPLNSKL